MLFSKIDSHPFWIFFNISFDDNFIKKITGKYLNQNIKAVLITALTLITLLIVTKSFIQANVVAAGYYTGTKIYTKDSTYVSDSTHFISEKLTVIILSITRKKNLQLSFLKGKCQDLNCRKSNKT